MFEHFICENFDQTLLVVRHIDSRFHSHRFENAIMRSACEDLVRRVLTLKKPFDVEQDDFRVTLRVSDFEIKRRFDSVHDANGCLRLLNFLLYTFPEKEQQQQEEKKKKNTTVWLFNLLTSKQWETVSETKVFATRDLALAAARKAMTTTGEQKWRRMLDKNGNDRDKWEKGNVSIHINEADVVDQSSPES